MRLNEEVREAAGKALREFVMLKRTVKPWEEIDENVREMYRTKAEPIAQAVLDTAATITIADPL